MVEAAGHIAPTIRGFRREGFYFDTGFHYTGMLGKKTSWGLLHRVGVWEKIVGIPLRSGQGDRLSLRRSSLSVQLQQGWKTTRQCSGGVSRGEAWDRCLLPSRAGALGAGSLGDASGRSSFLDQPDETGSQGLLSFLHNQIQDPR